MSDSKNDISVALDQNDIYDVYINNGKIYFLNQWDEESIRRVITDLFPGFDQKNIIHSEPQLVNY